jgi:hypothetical protein
MPWVLPVLAVVASVGSTVYSAVSSSQAQDAAEHQAKYQALAAQQAQKQAQQQWQNMAYPSSAALNAQAAENRGQLGQARLGAYQNLASQLGARGFGSGSGLGTQGAANIEQGYLQSLGQMGTELTKYAATPMFGPPSSAYPNPALMSGFIPGGGASPGASALGGAISPLSSAAGYLAMNQIINPSTSQTQQPGNSGFTPGGTPFNQYGQTGSNWPSYY